MLQMEAASLPVSPSSARRRTRQGRDAPHHLPEDPCPLAVALKRRQVRAATGFCIALLREEVRHHGALLAGIVNNRRFAWAGLGLEFAELAFRDLEAFREAAKIGVTNISNPSGHVTRTCPTSRPP